MNLVLLSVLFVSTMVFLSGVVEAFPKSYEPQLIRMDLTNVYGYWTIDYPWGYGGGFSHFNSSIIVFVGAILLNVFALVRKDKKKQ